MTGEMILALVLGLSALPLGILFVLYPKVGMAFMLTMIAAIIVLTVAPFIFNKPKPPLVQPMTYCMGPQFFHQCHRLWEERHA